MLMRTEREGNNNQSEMKYLFKGEREMLLTESMRPWRECLGICAQTNHPLGKITMLRTINKDYLLLTASYLIIKYFLTLLSALSTTTHYYFCELFYYFLAQRGMSWLFGYNIVGCAVQESRACFRIRDRRQLCLGILSHGTCQDTLVISRGPGLWKIDRRVTFLHGLSHTTRRPAMLGYSRGVLSPCHSRPTRLSSFFFLRPTPTATIGYPGHPARVTLSPLYHRPWYDLPKTPQKKLPPSPPSSLSSSHHRCSVSAPSLYSAHVSSAVSSWHILCHSR